MVRDKELPPANVRRWTVYTKAAVVRAVRGGLLSGQEAAKRYQLSEEELHSWERDFDQHGLYGLRAMQVQLYRRSKSSPSNRNRIDPAAITRRNRREETPATRTEPHEFWRVR